jgi:ferritin-like metal-binding protein YciE
MSGLTELFLEQLGNMVHVENLLIKALPRMAEVSRSEDLKEVFEMHFEETKKHLARVQKVFKGLGMDAREKKCDSMLALLTEARRVGDRWKNSPAIDAALICAAQRVEAHEIISYSSLCLWGEELGEKDAVKWLKENLEEEKLAEKKLSKLVQKAAQMDSQELAAI